MSGKTRFLVKRRENHRIIYNKIADIYIQVNTLGENNFQNFTKRFLYDREKKKHPHNKIKEIIHSKALPKNHFHQPHPNFSISNMANMDSLSIK